MPHEHAPAIEAAFSQVLEQMAFLFADPVAPDDVGDPPEDPIAARMTFSGAASGAITLHTDRAVCSELLENITGSQVEESPELENQALLELLNVICGRMLTRIAGDRPVFDLTPPHMLASEPDTWTALCQAPDTLAFRAEDHCFLLQVDYH